MEKKELTVIITTFKSENIIYSCLDSISREIKIIIIENSSNKKFKQEVELNYSNVNCILSGDNTGYAIANNLGLSKVKTKYALILNPDTKLEKHTIENFLLSANQNPNFWLMGPIQNKKKEFEIEKNQLIEVENLKGYAIFFNIEKFKNDFFDENYFLYFEEIDLCKKVIMKKGKIYLNSNIKIMHEGSKSVNQNFKEELEKNRNWHWMWSTFYFHRKYKGYLIASILIFPKLISSLFKTIFYFFIFKTKSRDIYFHRFSGIINSMLGKKSWHRPTID